MRATGLTGHFDLRAAHRLESSGMLPAFSWNLPPEYNSFPVEPVVRQFDSHAAAEAADRAYYRSLTPQQRLDILFDLVSRYREEHGCSDRLERVYRIVEPSQS